MGWVRRGARTKGKGGGVMKVERDGWFIDIETLDVSQRPDWEIRCRIRRHKDGQHEERGHRFYVPGAISDKLGLDELSDAAREERLANGAKRVTLRELEDIFLEPEGGLDSLRALSAEDLAPPPPKKKKR